MTKINDFKILIMAAGFSDREAADYLGAKHETLRQWASGRRNAPETAIRGLLPVAKTNCQDLYEEVIAIEKGLS